MIEERGIKLGIEPEEEPTKESEVFYNPEMTVNRDISTAALQVYQSRSGKDLEILDALSATGVRGLRYLKEVPGVDRAVLNDSKPEAFDNIERNLELNSIDSGRAESANKDANLLMTERRKGFDFVDIDPFGSPARFTDSAVRSMKHEGFAGFTATDLATLCGTYRKTCKRRYASWSLNTSYCHEVGLRVLIKFLFESFARFDRVFRPKIAFAEKHYYRVMGEVRHSKKAVNRMLDNIGFLKHCENCAFRELVEEAVRDRCPDCDEKLHLLGPIWIGKLGRKKFCKEVVDVLKNKDREDAAEIVEKLEKETIIKTPYYDTHKLAKVVGSPAPSRGSLLEQINNKGYRAVRT
ncbi:MAG: tRNA (guanine(10)-N(2))-dimethyltransferase, partial [Candidatus Nanohaloarchaea archaeon]|nr:tRNA (guanine(10)-N(2))-dimethyltransferase [Candidatus Nanohaloarchaea archaeon]